MARHHRDRADETPRMHPTVKRFADTIEGYDRLNDYIVDPAWDMTPAEYTLRREQSAGGAYGSAAITAGVSAATFAVPASLVDPSSIGLAAAAVCYGVSALPSLLGSVAIIHLIRGGRRASQMRRELDELADSGKTPILISSLDEFDQQVITRMLRELTAHPDEPERRPQVLGALYAFAADAVANPGMSPQAAALRDARDVHVSTVEDVGASYRARVETDARTWARACARFARVRAAWEELLLDPLNALDHAALFDVTQPRTAAFIDTYGQLTDLVAVHDGVQPADSESFTEFVTLARRTEQAWDQAWDHSTAAGYGWLPEVEHTRARRAATLLRVALDEALTPGERSAAAAKASELLAAIRTVVLPKQVYAELDTVARLELTPAAP